MVLDGGPQQYMATWPAYFGVNGCTVRDQVSCKASGIEFSGLESAWQKQKGRRFCNGRPEDD